MARSSRRRSKATQVRTRQTRTTLAPRAAGPPVKRAPAVRASAETLLLALARDLTMRAAALPRAGDVDGIVATLASQYGPDAPLATALREDWLRGRGDKTARLALAWAREQVRLALVDVLHRARAPRAMRTDGDTETVAWLWLAACEALAHEPASAVGDRSHALAAFLHAT
jgi:hypothetical protein